MKVWHWLLLVGLALCVSVGVVFSMATVTDSVGLSTDTEAGANQPDAEKSTVEQSTVEQSTAEQRADWQGDRLPHPPVRQNFRNGDFQLVITAVDGWETPGAIASLYKGDRLLWEQPLTHEYGPRFAVVGQQGQVLLLDEYINVASSRAITILNPDGNKIAQYSFEDISGQLAVPAATLTRHAASGWWITAVPSVPPEATTPEVFIPTGGTTLSVNLSTGEISRHDL